MKAHHLFFVFFVLLVIAGYFLTWGEWKGPWPPGMGPTEGWQRTTLPASFAIDLETGAVKDSQESTRDLWWEAKTQTEFCLCPYGLNKRDVLLARVPVEKFNSLDAAAASVLIFSEKGFRLGANDNEMAPGLGFVVRTGDGNLARVRVTKLAPDRSLTLEWRMFSIPEATPAISAPANPSLESRRLLAEVRDNLRGGKDLKRAAELLDQVLPMAEQHPAASSERIMLMNEIGQLYWSARRAETAVTVFTGVVADLTLHDSASGARPMPWQVVYDTHRWLGVLNRDMNRPDEAAPWLEKAAALAQSARPADHNEADMRDMSLASSLSELVNIECQLGRKESARRHKNDLRAACAAARNPESIGACRMDWLHC